MGLFFFFPPIGSEIWTQFFMISSQALLPSEPSFQFLSGGVYSHVYTPAIKWAKCGFGAVDNSVWTV